MGRSARSGPAMAWDWFLNVAWASQLVLIQLRNWAEFQRWVSKGWFLNQRIRLAPRTLRYHPSRSHDATAVCTLQHKLRQLAWCHVRGLSVCGACAGFNRPRAQWRRARKYFELGVHCDQRHDFHKCSLCKGGHQFHIPHSACEARVTLSRGARSRGLMEMTSCDFVGVRAAVGQKVNTSTRPSRPHFSNFVGGFMEMTSSDFDGLRAVCGIKSIHQWRHVLAFCYF